MAFTVTGPITITYAGGAAGPASTTQAALAAGFAIPTLPVGGTATFTAPVNITGTVQQSNTATIAPPIGTNDPTPGNNTSTAVTDPVIPPCCLAFSNVTVTPNPVPANTDFNVSVRVDETCGAPALAGSAVFTGLPGTISYLGSPNQTWPGLPSLGFHVMNWPVRNNSAAAQTINAAVHTDFPVGNCPPDVPLGFTTDAALPVADVRATLKVALRNNGGAVTAGPGNIWRMLFTNAGPDAADGAVIQDLVSSQAGVWNFTGTGTVQYSGGAAGPATVTIAQLVAGFAVTTWPNGGGVTVEMPTNFTAAAVGDNTVQVNPVGFTDPVLGNNQTTGTVTVPSQPPPCECTADVTYSTRAGSLLLGNYNSPATSPTCCDEVHVYGEIYPSLADAQNDANQITFIDSGILPCGGGAFALNLTGFESVGNFIKLLVRTTTLNPSTCEVAEGGGILTNPYGSRSAVRAAGTWTIRAI